MAEDKDLLQDQNEDAILPIDDLSEVELEPVSSQTSTAHDDFDWTIGKRNTVKYDNATHSKYLKEYDDSLNSVAELDVVKGRVTAIHGGDVILDINYKSDGLVSLSEFRDTPDIKVGDYVEVYVENKEDIRGQLVLSRRKAKLLKAWDNIVDSYKNGSIIKGYVTSKTKGGLIVDCLGIETFLPGSQIDVKPITDYDIYVGKTMEFKVVKINEAIKNAVVSHKALIESDLAEQRETIISGLEKGQVLEGVVKNITDFGAFMDLGGVDGLLYITDISWGRINHPNEILALNQKINVVVLDFGEDKKRISLGLKQLTPHPWEVLDNQISESNIVKGKIVNIEDYGAFLEIIPGVEGLIHVSEVNWSNQPVNARDFFNLGQDVEAKIVTIDRDERKMSLSIKQMTEDPWNLVAAKFQAGSKHTGEVKNLTPYGVFVELENGIGGMVHISDLSWTKRYSHPSEFTKVGEKIDVTILEVDEETRKLSLGHKQLEENPWDTFENVFPVGSYHEATVVKKVDSGAVVQLPYGLEAFAPSKHLKKEDNNNAAVEETLTFKVIEFNRDDKRIIVSHTRYVEDIRREADQIVDSEKEKERDEVKKTIKATQSKVEQSTFGDIEGFAELKGQFGTSAPAPKAEAVAPKVVETPAVVEETPAVVEETPEAVAVVETPVVIEEIEAEAPKAKASKTEKADDLKKIEGIGPKIEELLHAAGIVSFADLAAAQVDTIKEVLNAAGSRYQMHDPTSWPIQSDMAAKGEWDKLTEWQDAHKGGKID